MIRVSIAGLALLLAPALATAWHHRCCVSVVPVQPVAPAVVPQTSYVPMTSYVPVTTYHPVTSYAPTAAYAPSYAAPVSYAPPGFTITSLAIAPQALAPQAPAATPPKTTAAAPGADCCDELRAAIKDLRASMNTYADQVQRHDRRLDAHDEALKILQGRIDALNPKTPRPMPKGPEQSSIVSPSIDHLIGLR